MSLLKQLLGVKSVRVINRLLGHKRLLLKKCIDGLIGPQDDDAFPSFCILPVLTDILLFHT